jgi:hypothetical protein
MLERMLRYKIGWEEIAVKLSRTVNACKARWNTPEKPWSEEDDSKLKLLREGKSELG